MRRLLIVRMSALGDIVHALPVLSALKAADPTTEIDWLVERNYAGILDFVDGIANRIMVRPGYARAVRFMRARRYDAAVDLQGLIKSAIAVRLSAAPRRVGFERPALREPAAAWFYSETVAVPAHAHVIDKNCAVLRVLGVNPGPLLFPFCVPSSAVADRIRSQSANGFVLLNPGAAWPNKRWDPGRFGALAARIRHRYGLPSFVLWGRHEAELADCVVRSSDGAATRAPETGLGDLLALAQAARLMVSGDTGPLHIAAAMGTPLVGLYGPTWPERNGPWHPADEVISRASTCVCHHKRECRTGRMCINEIAVDDVLAAVERRLAKASG